MPINFTHHIVNKHALFASVSSEVDTDKLTDCVVFTSKEAMYKFVESQLDIDDAEGNEYTFFYQDNKWKSADGRGIVLPEDLPDDQTIEQYISEYEL